MWNLSVTKQTFIARGAIPSELKYNMRNMTTVSSISDKAMKATGQEFSRKFSGVRALNLGKEVKPADAVRSAHGESPLAFNGSRARKRRGLCAHQISPTRPPSQLAAPSPRCLTKGLVTPSGDAIGSGDQSDGRPLACRCAGFPSSGCSRPRPQSGKAEACGRNQPNRRTQVSCGTRGRARATA